MAREGEREREGGEKGGGGALGDAWEREIKQSFS